MNEEGAGILIVEGENLVAKDLEESLANLGYRIVAVVDSGRKAVQVAEQIRPDLALMDMQLTGSMDSYTAAGEIRKRLKIPIVFLMPKSEEDALKRNGAITQCGYVAKPFRSTELNATILLALNQNRLVHEMFAEQSWLATMLKSLNDAIIATDAKGCVSYLNFPAEALTGWSLGDALGLPIGQIYSLTTLAGEKVEECQLRMALYSKEAKPRGRFLLTNRSGSPVPIEDSAAPIMEGGHLLGAVAVFRDITDVLTREVNLARERERAEAQMHVAAEALGHSQSDLRSLSKHLINSHEQERRYLAKSFHNDFSQSTALLGLQLDALFTTVGDNAEALEQLRAMRSQVDSLSEGLRRTSHDLYPSALSDLGLLPALRELVEEFQSNGLDVVLRAKGTLPGQIPIEIAIAIYRIIEEAIVNPAKSTSDARSIIVVSVKEGQLQLLIEGAGADLQEASAQTGIGLSSIRERARIVGGSLIVSSVQGLRTQLIVRIPLVQLSSDL